LQAKEELADSTADIKQNFIHLISHNLNTPIAQLRGLLEVLSQDQPDEKRITSASRLLEFIRVTVRAVLNTSTMGNQEIRKSEHPLKTFLDSFMEFEMGFFKRTGIQLEITPDEEDEDLGSVYFYKFMLDKEISNASVLYACVLASVKMKSSKLRCDLKPINDEPADPQGLIITITALDDQRSSHLIEPDFPMQALTRFLEMAEARDILELEIDSSKIILKFFTNNRVLHV
jgi:hypothetical protein